MVNGRKFEIVKLENSNALVRDVTTGKLWCYGIDALRHLEAQWHY